MASENEQFGFQNRLDDFRKELDGKIEKKIPETTFWTVIGIIAMVILGGVVWFTTMNERMVKVETKIEMGQPHR